MPPRRTADTDFWLLMPFGGIAALGEVAQHAAKQVKPRLAYGCCDKTVGIIGLLKIINICILQIEGRRDVN